MQRRWIARLVLLLLVTGIQIPVKASVPVQAPPTVAASASEAPTERKVAPQPVKGSKAPDSFTATSDDSPGDGGGSGLHVTDMTRQSAQNLVQQIVGAEVAVSNAQLRGTQHSAGTFTGGSGILGFENGIVLSSGSVHNVLGPNESEIISTANDLPGDSALNGLIPGYSTYDASVLEFDITPTTDLMTFQFVFASDEYDEYVNSRYNDVFGFFVDGENIAIIPGTTNPVAINHINNGNPPGHNAHNPLFYRSNADGAINTEMDGMTVVMTVPAYVTSGQVAHIKLAIADAGDHVLDSNVFIRAVKMVQPPKVEMTKLNVSGDSYYDDTYKPGDTVLLSTAVYMPRGTVLDTAETYVDGTLIDSQSATSSMLVSWTPPAGVTSHEVRVVVSDTDGNHYTGTLTLYGLVSVQGSVASYLPKESVQSDELRIDLSPFHEDDRLPEQPFELLQDYYANHIYRQINTVTVEGKSDGSQFVSKPRAISELNKDRMSTQSWYCDDPLNGLTREAYINTYPTITREEYDGSHYAASQFMESMVNARSPDVWNAAVVNGANLMHAPLPPRNEYTGGHPMVPTIFSTVGVEIWADGRAHADWVDDKSGPKMAQSSWFPYHYAYQDGRLVGGAGSHPEANLKQWTATTPGLRTMMEAITKINKVPHVEIDGDQLALKGAMLWFSGLRAECARMRLQRSDPAAYEALHKNAWKTIPIHMKPGLWLALKPELWPHIFPAELREGAPHPYERGPCQAPGCPNAERKVWFISYYSPVHAHVYDASGEHTGLTSDGGVELGLPDVAYRPSGHVTTLVVPAKPDYRVEFEGYDQGTVTMNLTLYDGPDKVRYLQYLNVPVGANSKGTVSLGDDTQSAPVMYDHTGSGTPQLLTPSINNSNPAPDDTDALAPTTSVTLTGTEAVPGSYQSPVQITFTGSDDLSGVDHTEYSLDSGATWVRYGLPVTLSDAGEHRILYHSVDYNGNQESDKSALFRIERCELNPSLTWNAPLRESDPATLSKGETLPIRFFWGKCGELTRDESVVITITDTAQPDMPITTWVHGADITIDETAREYRQSFRPDIYGIAPGTNLAVDVFLNGQHAGRSLIRVGP